METLHGGAVSNLNGLLAKELYDIYNPAYRPPKFSLESFLCPIEYQKYAPEAKIYCDEDAGMEQVKIVGIHRQPVNILMNTEFDEEKLLRLTGISDSGYTFVYQKFGSCLPPNIGIYTLTKVHDQKLDKYYNDVHIYHAIGYAFDCKSQIDYQVLTQYADINAKTSSLYYKVFVKIFKCAVDHDLNHVLMSLVGANNFTIKYPLDSFRFKREVWVPAFKTAHQLPRYRHLKIDGMGTGWPTGIIGKSKGLFPGVLQKIDLTDTLIVNAWDPHSVIGNGNAKDNSLDGYVGRNCNAHFYGWGLTNPHLLANIRPVQVM